MGQLFMFVVGNSPYPNLGHLGSVKFFELLSYKCFTMSASYLKKGNLGCLLSYLPRETLRQGIILITVLLT